MTIADTVADEHYEDPRRLSRDLADALNVEIRALAEAGAAVRRACPGSWGAVCEPYQRLARRSLRQIIESEHQSAVR